MKQLMIKLFTLIAIVLVSHWPQTLFAQQNPVYSKEIEERIAQVERSLAEAIKTDDKPLLLQERMKFYNVPGVSIGVIKDHKLEWARGYGYADREQTIPVTTQTLFQAASISKSLNAVGVLRLAQAGRVNLDADINTYLTTWKFPYDSAKGKKLITLRKLLSHTAGTSVHGFRGYAAGEEIPAITQILNGDKPANSQPVRSLFDAGTKFQYSGGGTTISQLIVMDVTGQPYDEYARKGVLDLLGMKTSFYSPPTADRKEPLATGYRGNGNPVKGKYHVYPEQAAASLWTNPTELAKFITELQLAYAGKSAKVLTREWASLMFTPVMNEVALGTFIRTVGDEKYFSHGGANEGFRCIYLGHFENGNGVVVMVNSDNGNILQEIVNSVATVYHWKDFYKPEIRTVVTVPDEILDSYVGEYAISEQFKITIRRDGHALKARATNQPEVDLFAEEQNKFFLKVVQAQIEFVKDDNHVVTKLILHQNGQAMEGTRVK
jgi:CubicO group peptidase (beta-lactamase class C family)